MLISKLSLPNLEGVVTKTDPYELGIPMIDTIFKKNVDFPRVAL